MLSLLYLVSTTLKRYEVEGRQRADKPLLDWAVWDAMFKAQNAMEGVIANFPSKPFAWLMHQIVFPFGRPYVVPSDKLGHEVAKLLIEPSATRDRLTAGMFLPKSEKEPLAVLEAALVASIQAEVIEAKIRAAQKDGHIGGETPEELVQAAAAKGVINPTEQALLARAAALRAEVVRVDDFPQDFGLAEAARPQTRAAA